MLILRDASEDEMVLAFLREELNSGRFREPILKALNEVGVSEDLILEGHCRATSYALFPEAFEGSKTYVGFCSAEALSRKAPKLIVRAGEKKK